MQRSIHKKFLALVVALLAAMCVMIPAREAKALDTTSIIGLWGYEPMHKGFSYWQLCLDSENGFFRVSGGSNHGCS